MNSAVDSRRPIESELFRRVSGRFSRAEGCLAVWYEPSQRDTTEVVAAVYPAAFLGQAYSSLAAYIHVTFDLATECPYYRIRWWEPEIGRGIGWHADETESEYGPAHLQIEYADGTTERRSADHVEDEHPYRSFERRFTAIPGMLAELGWE